MFVNFSLEILETVQLQCFHLFSFVLSAVAIFRSTLFVCGRACNSALMSCCLPLVCCLLAVTLKIPFRCLLLCGRIFFVPQIFINSAATVFPNIFISFDSGRKLKSTLFECALYELPNGRFAFSCCVVEKQLFATFLWVRKI